MKVTVIPIVSGALDTVTKDWNCDWWIWKSEDESIPSKLQHD